jgi:hypothetical protein
MEFMLGSPTMTRESVYPIEPTADVPGFVEGAQQPTFSVRWCDL